MKKITLKDIADMAGVSTAVVSCVVNNKPNGYGDIRISAPVREKIKALIEELDYRPSRLAKALKTGDNRTLGIIAVHSTHPLHSYRTLRLSELIADQGYDYIMQLMKWGEAEAFQKAVEMLIDYGVRGLILSNIQLPSECFDRIHRVAESGLPVIEISDVSHGEFPNVWPDYYHAALKMATQVIAKGRTNIYALTSFQPSEDFKSRVEASERIRGIRDACSEVEGVKFNVFYRTSKYIASNVDDGFETTSDLLSEHTPDAIFYSNDFLAIGGLRALKLKGVRVPKDIYVCGFDGVDVAAYSDPPITTVMQPVDEIAAKTVETLFGMIKGEQPVSRKTLLTPCNIVLRESTG